MKPCFLYVTFANQDEAQNIAKQLVTEQLIACANIFPPMTSVYSWEEKLQVQTEVVAVLKTRGELSQRVQERVLSLHSYDCPCIATIEVSTLNAGFQDWLVAATSK